MLDLKCHQTLFEAVVYTDPIEGLPPVPGTTFTGAYTPEIGPMRLPKFAHPTMVHIRHNGCTPCLLTKIERVVECPAGCERDEYKWEICTRHTAHILLPPGLYDITICKQLICGLEDGDLFEGSILLEPVDEIFVHTYRINEGCC